MYNNTQDENRNNKCTKHEITSIGTHRPTDMGTLTDKTMVNRGHIYTITNQGEWEPGVHNETVLVHGMSSSTGGIRDLFARRWKTSLFFVVESV